MDLKKEQQIKSKLGLILKILLITVAIFKLGDIAWKYLKPNSSNTNTRTENTAVNDSTADAYKTEAEGIVSTQEDTLKEVVKPLANSASIYIFGSNGLDSGTSRHIGSIFFKDYKLMGTPSGFQKEELLLGNLSSAANTELVCVGTVRYSYKKTSMGDTTCFLNIDFDTYNKGTGAKVKALSKSIFKKGLSVGDDKEGALREAFKKIH